MSRKFYLIILKDSREMRHIYKEHLLRNQSMASHARGIGKQHRPISDTTELFHSGISVKLGNSIT